MRTDGERAAGRQCKVASSMAVMNFVERSMDQRAALQGFEEIRIAWMICGGGACVNVRVAF